MTDTSTRTVRGPRRKKTRLVAAGAVILLLAFLVVAYMRVGWWQMESECSLGDADGAIHSSVTYDWSWEPLGFTCTYDNGQSETSLWF